ncbi:unnamed protein product [Echinostoma caproni]|uniref:Variant surface glycoprotein n=1 Tax=Echinostoma caproni TaxID=27848 RepID=A0A183B5J8_9TREM|nr:unnamed protein product [Echinostoma caproni]
MLLQSIRHEGLLLAASQLQWPEDATDVHKTWDRIKTKIISLADAFASLLPHGRLNRPWWWSRWLAKLLSRKRAAWKRFLATNGHSRYLQYLKERNTYDRAQSDSKKRYELTLEQKSKTCPKAYYGYVQSKAATGEAIGCIRDAGGNPTITSLEKASALQQHYEESFTGDLDNALPAHSITTEYKAWSQPQTEETKGIQNDKSQLLLAAYHQQLEQADKRDSQLWQRARPEEDAQ